MIIEFGELKFNNDVKLPLSDYDNGFFTPDSTDIKFFDDHHTLMYKSRDNGISYICSTGEVFEENCLVHPVSFKNETYR